MIPLEIRAVDRASDWLIANLGTVKRQTDDVEIESNVHWLPTAKKGRGSVSRCINVLQMEMVLISAWLSLGMSLHFCTDSMTARPIPLAFPDHMKIIIIFVSITHQAVRMLLSSRTLDFHWTRQYWVPVSLPAASCKMQPTARQ